MVSLLFFYELAVEDYSIVLGQLTSWLPPKLTSMPPGSKSSIPPLSKKRWPKKPLKSRKPSLVPEPDCTNEEPFWKLPVLPNCIAGVHWLAKSPLLETRNPRLTSPLSDSWSMSELKRPLLSKKWSRSLKRSPKKPKRSSKMPKRLKSWSSWSRLKWKSLAMAGAAITAIIAAISAATADTISNRLKILLLYSEAGLVSPAMLEHHQVCNSG